MPLFPMFVDLTDKPVVIIGSGHHVSEKAEKLAPFGCHLRYCATEAFAPELLEGAAAVILADRHHPRNAALAALCREKGIPVNAVDDPPLCDFQFPSLVCREDLVIAISTAGKAPALGKLLRRELEERLPDRTEEILAWSSGLTRELRREIPDLHTRGQILQAILREALKKNRPLTREELTQFMS